MADYPVKWLMTIKCICGAIVRFKVHNFYEHTVEALKRIAKITVFKQVLLIVFYKFSLNLDIAFNILTSSFMQTIQKIKNKKKLRN